MTFTLAVIIIVFGFGLVLVAGLLWEYFSETYDEPTVTTYTTTSAEHTPDDEP